MAINNIGDSQQFNFTGGVQTLTITKKGLYKLEVWGGKGGKGTNKNGSGGNGGKSSGYKVFNPGEVLYVCCGGGLNSTYNGGGNSTSSTTAWAGKGGGATHIATVTGTLASIGSASLDKILIVAGGGGGGGETNTDGTVYKYGGTGGGTNGGDASGGAYRGKGASQTQGGQGYLNYSSPEAITYGSFGQGGSASQNPSSGAFYGGGGGGGLYGGGGGSWSATASNCGGGGGGSGYIGGVPEITYKGTTYSPETTNGVNSGNGYAVITLVDANTDNCRFKVNGEWKNAMLYKKINGEWVTGMLRTKVSGSWKNGG